MRASQVRLADGFGYPLSLALPAPPVNWRVTPQVPMAITARSFAKINFGLQIGRLRADGFHELRTIYQTIALHDVIRVDVQRGVGIEIRCADPRVPTDETNTCYRMADRVLKALKQRAKILIHVEKQLPVQGGLGAGSSNAVATLLALERALGTKLAGADRLRIAAEVGSDLPLFLLGGTVLGVDRGQEVYPLPDLPPLPLIIVTPEIGVSTPAAFARWDALAASEALTSSGKPATINEFSQSVYEWLSESLSQAGPASGVPAMGGDRAETPLLDLVRAGIENDFERVVFPEYPDLREVKRVLEREGARYASLSGSGSALYGVFATPQLANAAAERMRAAGYPAQATSTLTRKEYWKQLAIRSWQGALA